MRRREFLRLGALAVGAAPFTPLERAGAGKKIVVLGAGLSGLAAGYELMTAGHDVTIIEARARTGGRVHTLREPFAEGLYAEAGAARIPSNHEWTLRYAKHFELPLERFYPDGARYIDYRRGSGDEVNWEGYESGHRRHLHFALGRDPAKWFKIRGGNDLLPGAFAARLAGRIILGSPVARIEQNDAGVSVTFRRSGAQHRMAADRLICTVPFSVLNRIEVSPPLSPARRHAIEDVHYASASRVFGQVRRRFWTERGLNGFAITDEPLEIWSPSFSQPGTRGILATYARGAQSEQLTALPEGRRIDTTMSYLDRVFPGTREAFETGAAKCWSEDEWSRGAWASYANDSQLKLIAQPEGRIHFAGEHTSRWPSWMQGALESGSRAAREVNEASRS